MKNKAVNENNNVMANRESFLMIVDMLNSLNIRYWIEGGWGIDVLIGKQTRPHRDIDVDFDADYENVLLDRLAGIGYQIITDARPIRIELYHSVYGFIDIHPFILSEPGRMRQANPDGGWFDLDASWFSEAVFEGRIIPCVSTQGQRLFHSGYELREIDQADLKSLNDAFPQTDVETE